MAFMIFLISLKYNRKFFTNRSITLIEYYKRKIFIIQTKAVNYQIVPVVMQIKINIIVLNARVAIIYKQFKNLVYNAQNIVKIVKVQQFAQIVKQALGLKMGNAIVVAIFVKLVNIQKNIKQCNFKIVLIINYIIYHQMVRIAKEIQQKIGCMHLKLLNWITQQILQTIFFSPMKIKQLVNVESVKMTIIFFKLQYMQ
ncbi:unnamed protein product [Paramecium sonneborni]|uniref:Uncharacterized protein n=1 Tax=Paramecium sonneborni TaxID=65129 RepID=A0A8S1RT10_9CILI|nr:unnamed protein product [Paramecium sonneborni]